MKMKSIFSFFVILFFVTSFLIICGCTDEEKEVTASVQNQKVEELIDMPESDAVETQSNVADLEEKKTDEVTIQFPEEKKEELVKILKTYYGVKDVRVIFVPKTKSLMVDYYVYNVSTETDLHDEIVNIIIISKSIATEAGITNPNVVVGALSSDENLLGQGYYYSSTDKTNVDIFLKSQP